MIKCPGHAIRKLWSRKSKALRGGCRRSSNCWATWRFSSTPSLVTTLIWRRTRAELWNGQWQLPRQGLFPFFSFFLSQRSTEISSMQGLPNIRLDRLCLHTLPFFHTYSSLVGNSTEGLQRKWSHQNSHSACILIGLLFHNDSFMSIRNWVERSHVGVFKAGFICERGVI